jgi:hypothetical protein
MKTLMNAVWLADNVLQKDGSKSAPEFYLIVTLGIPFNRISWKNEPDRGPGQSRSMKSVSTSKSSLFYSSVLSLFAEVKGSPIFGGIKRTEVRFLTFQANGRSS